MIRLYDTLSSEKKPFETQEEGKAKIYVCGPTVYDFAHLGHARCYIVYDVLIRHLRASGLDVKYVRNITDIDDKILKRAAENDEEPAALAERFTEAFQNDMTTLGCLVPDVEPKVSEHLEQIFAMVQTLIDKGHAYVSDGDVYFAVETFDGYGKLSHRDLSKSEAGASGRVDDEQAKRKKHPADFALWKSAAEGARGWDSPWGHGRPGWHIECSAMSTTHLGETLDLHGGGLDLVFPHHENEIAQSEAATGKPFSRHWVHNGFVEVDKEKMSKSLGNFFTARQLFDRVEPEAIRILLFDRALSQQPLNFSRLDAGFEEGNATGASAVSVSNAGGARVEAISTPPNNGWRRCPRSASSIATIRRPTRSRRCNLPAFRRRRWRTISTPRVALAALAELLRSWHQRALRCERCARNPPKSPGFVVDATASRGPHRDGASSVWAWAVMTPTRKRPSMA